jgi:ribosomal protein S3
MKSKIQGNRVRISGKLTPTHSAADPQVRHAVVSAIREQARIRVEQDFHSRKQEQAQ